MTSYVIYIVFIFFGLEKTLTLRNWHPFSLWPSCVYCNTKYYIYFTSLHIASFLHKESFLFPLKFRQSNPPTQFQPSPKTNTKKVPKKKKWRNGATSSAGLKTNSTRSNWYIVLDSWPNKTTQNKSSLWFNRVVFSNTCLIWWLPCVPRDHGPCPKPFYMHGVNMSFLWNLFFLVSAWVVLYTLVNKVCYYTQRPCHLLNINSWCCMINCS